MKQSVTITCPVCQTVTSREIVTRIDAQKEPELKAQLLAGTLFNFECDHCGAQRQLDTDFLYIDRDLRLIVSLIPNLDQRKESMEELLGHFIRESDLSIYDYHLRVVRTAPELVEKVSIFQEGLNDIVVEIVKLLTDGLFAKERPQDHVKARYFYLHQGVPKILYLIDKDQLLVDFHESLVTFSQNKFKQARTEDYQGRFIVVDQNWAARLLEDKLGQTVKEYQDQTSPTPLSRQDHQRIQKKLRNKRRHS